ncbi:MAG: TldD/PmbA family protein [Fervidicoccaceae archaeon]
MEDLAELAVERALELGADYAEARVHSIVGTGLHARNESLVGVEARRFLGLAVRVIVDGALSFTSTSRLTREEARRAAEAAYSSARALSAHVRRPVEFSRERLGRADVAVRPKKDPLAVSREELSSLARELWSGVSSSASRVKVSVLYQHVLVWVEEKLIVNSDGGMVRSYTPRSSYFYNLALSSEKGALNRWYELSASGGPELLDSWRLSERLSDELIRLERVLVEGRSPPSGKFDVVLGSEIVGLAVHESCGHPLEADRILGREAAQGGRSYAGRDAIGTRLGGEIVSVVDDPTIPGSNGFYLYDDETVPARKRYLMRRGVIEELLHNRWTGSVFGVGSNGSARSSSHVGEPIIRMANTYMEPGDHSLEELLEGLKEGIYVRSYMEWNIDDRRWTQRYVGLEAYYVRGGELLHPLRNVAMELTTAELYSNIDALGRELEFHAGVCGKGEPSQGVPIWAGGPHARVRGVRVRAFA